VHNRRISLNRRHPHRQQPSPSAAAASLPPFPHVGGRHSEHNISSCQEGCHQCQGCVRALLRGEGKTLFKGSIKTPAAVVRRYYGSVIKAPAAR
jgi:hypothetical protein